MDVLAVCKSWGGLCFDCGTDRDCVLFSAGKIPKFVMLKLDMVESFSWISVNKYCKARSLFDSI